MVSVSHPYCVSSPDNQLNFVPASALLIGPMLVVGCLPKAQTTSGTPISIHVGNIGKRLGCPPDQITFTEQGAVTTLLAEGCGHSEMYFANVSGVWIPMQDLGARAAFDFDCPKDDVTLSALSARQQGVRGCGKRAVYTYVRTDERRWDWIMDSVGISLE